MKLRFSRITLSDAFTAFVVLTPILEYYRSPFPVLNLASFLALMFIFTFVFNKNKITLYLRNLTPAWVFLVYITFNVIITSLLYHYPFEWDTYRVYFRLLVLFFAFLVLGIQYFDLKKALLFLEKVLSIASVAIILHVVIYSVTGISIHLIIKPLIETDNISIGATIRSGGIYMEPAHYAQNAVLYCSFYCFSKEMRKILNSKCFILIILGIIFSTSGQGYAMLIALYSIWLLWMIFSRKAGTRLKCLAIFSVFLFALFTIIVYKIPVVQYGVSRILDDGGAIGGEALKKRTWTNYKFYELTEVQRLFGVGFGKLRTVSHGYYVNSLFSYLIQCGYFSVPLFAFLVVYYFVKGPRPIKVYLFLFVAMYTFSDIADVMSLCQLLCFYSSAISLKACIDDNERSFVEYHESQNMCSNIL